MSFLPLQQQLQVMPRSKASQKSSLSYFGYHQLSVSKITVKIVHAVPAISRNKQTDRQKKKVEK